MLNIVISTTPLQEPSTYIQIVPYTIDKFNRTIVNVVALCYILRKKNGHDDILSKLTLGEKLKDLIFTKGYKSTEQLASILNIPKTTLNDYENVDCQH